MLRFVLGAALLLASIQGANGDEPRNVSAEVGRVSHSSGWTDEKPGLIVVKDSEAYIKALRLIYGRNLERIDPRPFDDRYLYLYLFAGQTTAGDGHEIEVVSVKRAGPSEGGRRANDRIVVKARIISHRPQGGVAITVMHSPWVLVKVKKSEIPGGLPTGATRFVLEAERLERIGTLEVEALPH